MGVQDITKLRMNSEDEEDTTFRTPKGIFCYKVMSFGLKNAPVWGVTPGWVISKKYFGSKGLAMDII
jgi:hypothetical protein